MAQGIRWPDSKCEFAFSLLKEPLIPSWGPTLPKPLPPNVNIGITFPTYVLGKANPNYPTLSAACGRWKKASLPRNAIMNWYMHPSRGACFSIFAV